MVWYDSNLEASVVPYSRCSVLNYWTTSSSFIPLALLLLPLVLYVLPQFLCQDFHYANVVKSNLKSDYISLPQLKSFQTTYFLFIVPMEIRALWAVQPITFWCADMLRQCCRARMRLPVNSFWLVLTSRASCTSMFLQCDRVFVRE